MKAEPSSAMGATEALHWLESAATCVFGAVHMGGGSELKGWAQLCDGRDKRRCTGWRARPPVGTDCMGALAWKVGTGSFTAQLCWCNGHGRSEWGPLWHPAPRGLSCLISLLTP